MIKKDIVYANESKENKELTNKEIDDIFANADAQMDNMEKASIYTPKKKKKHSLKSMLIKTGIAIIVSFIVLIGFIVYVFSKQLPVIKQGVLEQTMKIREDFLKSDDSKLTIDEYYQKQALLLITPEELSRELEEVDSISMLWQAINNDGNINLDLIPEDKKDEYERLQKEYEEAKRTGVIPGLENKLPSDETTKELESEDNKTIENNSNN